MRERGERTFLKALFALCVLAWVFWLARHFPAQSDYRMAADEGTYFRQASTLMNDTFGGFAELCARYVSDPAQRTAPPPFRIAHVVVASLVVRVWPSVVALSGLSLLCHALLGVSVYAWGRRLWDERIAFAAGVLQLVSPLASGVAVRALADTHVALATTNALLACACFVKRGLRRDFRVFVAALAYALLLKETNYLLVPFFALALFTAQRAWRDALVVCLVPIATLALTALCLGGVTPFGAALSQALGFNAQEPHAYLAAYGAGPWYEYLVDYVLLSPVVALLALGYAGQLADRRPLRAHVALLAAFAPYFLLVFAALPKNPRFALPLDPLLRIAAAAFVAQGARERMLSGLALVALVALDVGRHRHFFVDGAIYDPVAYNLLAAERMIPVPDSALSPAQRVAELDRRARAQRTAESYLALSLAQYDMKDYAGALRASMAAVAQKPDFAPAYNNMGLAHAQLGHFAQAVDAFEVALRLSPDFQLAKNNLAWAREQAVKSGAR